MTLTSRGTGESQTLRGRTASHSSRRLALGAAGVLAALALLVGACSGSRGDELSGSGVLETRSYDLGGFDSLDAGSAFDVRAARGTAFAVAVTADDNLFDEIRVATRDERLVIRLREGTSLRPGATLRAKVTMPGLLGVAASGASDITIESGFPRLPRIDVSASGASRVQGALRAATLEAELSGASSLALTGRADELLLAASGASRLRLEGFPAARATIELSGASTADVHVTESLDRVRVSGASRLRYTGSPQLGDVETSGASAISAGGG